MVWIALLLAIFMFLGLRDRKFGGSTHLTALVVIVAALVYAFAGLGH